MEFAVYLAVVVGFAGYFFNVFGHDVIAFAKFVWVAQEEHIGVDGVFVVWVFNRGVLVSRQDFHVPQLVLVGNHNDVAFG